MVDVLQRWRLGSERLKARDHAGAIAAFRAALDADPRHVPSLLALSRLESAHGSYRDARSLALRAFGLRVVDTQALVQLVGLLRLFNEGEAIRTCMARLPSLARIDVPSLLGFASQLSSMNEQEAALGFLDEARRADPEYPPTLVARAQVLTYLGRFAEARSELERCLQRAPDVVQAYWLLSRLQRWSANDNHVDRMRRLLAGPVGQGAGAVAILGFALHKQLDDIGDHANAWAALEAACRARRSTLQYRADDSRALIEQLIRWRAPSTESLDGRRLDEGPAPVFIVGMHRSGTTLLEQMLAGSRDVRNLGELYDFTAQLRLGTDYHCRGVLDLALVEKIGQIDHVDFRSLGEGYIRGLQWRLGEERCFTDKLPSNFLNLGFICEALPHARILHMTRDPIETCFSNLRELFGDANAYSYDLGELADYYLQYRRLMAHWRERYPGRILDVDYASLTLDPEATMRAVAMFCGVPFEPDMLAPASHSRGVATASAVQVRDKIVARETPKWVPYRAQLDPLISRVSR